MAEPWRAQNMVNFLLEWPSCHGFGAGSRFASKCKRVSQIFYPESGKNRGRQVPLRYEFLGTFCLGSSVNASIASQALGSAAIGRSYCIEFAYRPVSIAVEKALARTGASPSV
jgi:hypothetical protein